MASSSHEAPQGGLGLSGDDADEHTIGVGNAGQDSHTEPRARYPMDGTSDNDSRSREIGSDEREYVDNRQNREDREARSWERRREEERRRDHHGDRDRPELDRDASHRRADQGSWESRRRQEDQRRDGPSDKLEKREASDDEGDTEEKKRPELPKHLQADLLRELSPKLREELCRVLRAQDLPEGKRPPLSPELSRILARFQRRAELASRRGYGDESSETWPMYLGLVLFAIIVSMFVYLWLEEKYTSWEEGQQLKRRLSEDDFWRKTQHF